MRTVVTGGAGFIGSNLVKDLLDYGRDVTVVDDLSRGKLENLPNGIKPDLIELDLRDPQSALQAIQGAETVFHLAARVGGIDYLHGNSTNELQALQSNLLIDTNVFRACLKARVENLIYASSVAIYPLNLQERFNAVLSDEDHFLSDPEGGYGWAKLLGETQLRWINHMNIAIARIFNVYGRNSDLVKAPHVVSTLLLRAIRGEDLIVWGAGRQTRDFIHVSDCVEALLRLEQKASVSPVTINIGSGQPTSMLTLAKKISKVSGKHLTIKLDTSKPMGPGSRTADVTKAKRFLNWIPSTNLEAGLMDTYNWIEGVKKSGNIH